LDSNILIAAMKGNPAVRQRLEALPLTSLRLSAIVLGELEFGVEKSAQSQRNRTRLATIAQRLPLVGIDEETTRRYGQIRWHLERKGKPIGANDTWIAAQALAIEATLVTDNQREFSRIPALPLENWLVMEWTPPQR
jgi:tRNA(fMet)-specific endonuclease VapC